MLADNKHLHLLNKDHCYCIPAGNPIVFIEKKQGGEGRCDFLSKDAVLMIDALDKGTAIWGLDNQKCAEGAFLQIDEEGHKTLHIVEMKSGCRTATLAGIFQQLEGMYFAAISIMSILQLGLPDKVLSYLFYKELKSEDLTLTIEEFNSNISNDDDLPPIFHKQLVGELETVAPELSYWVQRRIPFTHTDSDLIIQQRSVSGDCSYGMV